MMKQQDEGDQQAGDAPGIGDLQRRRHHQLLIDHVGGGRQEDLGDEDCHHQSAERGEEALGPGGRRETTAVMRMCSPRRSAMTAPSITSQRNSNPATSSLQNSGLFSA